MTPRTSVCLFPLDDGELPRVSISDSQAKEYRHAASEVVRKTLAHETKFRYKDNETLDDADWKFVKAKERMRVYKRAATRAVVAPSTSTFNISKHTLLSPMVLAVGCMEGKLEDVLYGLHHKTTREMRSVTSFLNKNHVDAAVLANIDQGTPEDPFRYLGLKWRVVQTPGGGKLIRKRDVCTLEHLGIDVDEHGHKYGFHLMKSVDLDDQLPVSSKGDIVRAQVMLCCIYRQLTPTVVGVYAKAIFDLSGDLVDFLSYFTAAELVLGISKALECAAVKRLTLLALDRDLVTSELMCSSARKPSVDSDIELHKDGDANAADECSVCLKRRFFLKPHLRMCRICANVACAKCVVKMWLFARPHNVQIACCKACVIESRELEIDPRMPHPELRSSEVFCP